MNDATSMSHNLDKELIEYLFSGYIRVQRGCDTPQDIFATLEARSARGPLPEFSERERSQLLDLPDSDAQEAVLKSATDLSYEELARKAVWTQDPIWPQDHVRVLTSAEWKVLANRFWPDVTAKEHQRRNEVHTNVRRGRIPGQPKASPPGRILLSLKSACFNLERGPEQKAFHKAYLLYGPGTPKEKAASLCTGSRPWVEQWFSQHVVPQTRQAWGYVIFTDKQAKEHIDSLEPTYYGSCPFQDAFYNATSEALDYIHAPDDVSYSFCLEWKDTPEVLLVTKQDTSDLVRSNTKYMFYEWPQNAEVDDDALAHMRCIFLLARKEGLTTGTLNNVFLAVDSTCVNSCIRRWSMPSDHTGIIWRDNMRVLAVDPDYPQPNQTYPEGYKGCLWVRIQQLVDKFFEMRWFHPEVRLEQLWLAARNSSNEAFASMQPEEAKKFSWSTPRSKSFSNNFLTRWSLFYDIYYSTNEDWVVV